MPVNATHPQYDANLNRWNLVRDVVNSNVKQYIKDVDSDDELRNIRYKDDARFTNFTGRTKNGLVGAVFRKDVEIDLPEYLDYLVNDATGNKTTLEKLSQEVTGEVIQSGRYGLLTDYPMSEKGLTAAQVAALDLKARFNKYNPESIINWQCQVRNGQYRLSLVVLLETIDTIDEDGFTWIEEIQYRVLRLIEGIYWQQLYNEEFELVDEYTPLNFTGQILDYIPFVFVGSEDNDVNVDKPPILDLSNLNIGHLRNSADYEESIHITGQPTFIVSSPWSAEQFDEAYPDGIKIGSRTGHNLGEGGSAQLLQAAPNQLADVAMQRKEEQAVMIGARLVVPSSSADTVDAVRLKSASETSVLGIIVQNVETAIEQSIIWAANFMGNEELAVDDFVFNINKDFFDTTLSPQEVIAQIQLVDRQIIAKEDVRHSLRKSGLIEADRTDEDIEAEVEEVNPLV